MRNPKYVVGFLITCLAIFPSQVAKAQSAEEIVEDINMYSQMFNYFLNQITRMQEYMSNIGEKLGISLNEEIGNIIAEQNGALGLPDLQKIEEQTNEELDRENRLQASLAV
jgi:hypothetical protein